LGYREDIALESGGGQLIHHTGVEVTECRPAANLVDLLRVKREFEQVTNRLLEAGKNQEGPVLGHLSNEQFERCSFASHSRGMVAGHHSELVEVGHRAQGIWIRPERDRQFWAHGGSPARSGRSKRSSTEAPASSSPNAIPGSMSSNTGMFRGVGIVRTRLQSVEDWFNFILRSSLCTRSAVSSNAQVSWSPGLNNSLRLACRSNGARAICA